MAEKNFGKPQEILLEFIRLLESVALCDDGHINFFMSIPVVPQFKNLHASGQWLSLDIHAGRIDFLGEKWMELVSFIPNLEDKVNLVPGIGNKNGFMICPFFSVQCFGRGFVFPEIAVESLGKEEFSQSQIEYFGIISPIIEGIDQIFQATGPYPLFVNLIEGRQLFLGISHMEIVDPHRFVEEVPVELPLGSGTGRKHHNANQIHGYAKFFHDFSS
jgi:hypothetical protein